MESCKLVVASISAVAVRFRSFKSSVADYLYLRAAANRTLRLGQTILGEGLSLLKEQLYGMITSF